MKIGGAPTQADFHEAISARSDRWFSACLKITRNPDMAADAVQDALLNAWNKRHQVAAHAIRIARSNPIRALRYE